jgi:hypothetical protein
VAIGDHGSRAFGRHSVTADFAPDRYPNFSAAPLPICDTHHILTVMIRSFADKGTERLFRDGECPARWRSIETVALRKLDMVDAATRLTIYFLHRATDWRR